MEAVMSETLKREVDALMADWWIADNSDDNAFNQLVDRSDAVCLKIARELSRDSVLQFLLEKQVRTANENGVPDGTAFLEVMLGEWVPQVFPEFTRGEPPRAWNEVKRWVSSRLSAVSTLIERETPQQFVVQARENRMSWKNICIEGKRRFASPTTISGWRALWLRSKQSPKLRAGA
jgi:hypothetical protein